MEALIFLGFLMYLFYLIFIKKYKKVENKTTTTETVVPRKSYKEQHVFLENVKQAEVSSPVSYNQAYDNQAKCPNCMSTSIHADKKGFGWGKSLAGGFMLGPLGLLAGGIGAKKIQVQCINCGYKWNF